MVTLRCVGPSVRAPPPPPTPPGALVNLKSLVLTAGVSLVVVLAYERVKAGKA